MKFDESIEYKNLLRLETPLPTELLTSKLFIPPLRLGLVARPRLVQSLSHGLHKGCKLTLVSAPAGFGKTTLVVDWLKQNKLDAAWLSLDEADNDLPRFLAYLAAAFQQVDEQIGLSLLDALQSPQILAIDKVLTGLLNEFTYRKEPLILVLDDYHLLSQAKTLQVIEFLLRHQPAQLHLVLTTREDPDLPLARLRARDQLNEIRARDLRFTLEEANSFLRGAMGLDLSGHDIEVLEDRTEGWVVGLQLAGLSMQKQADLKSFIEDFSGSHRYILDYLTDEVLQHQPEEIRTFLLQTSILDRLSGPLCDSLTEVTGSDKLLAHLEASNLFVIPLDEERRWYRYHHLFADLLHNQLVRSQPELVPELHRRASLWFEGEGNIQTAVEHALQASDLDRASRLIEEHALINLFHGEVAKVVGWYDRLPEEVLQAAPMLCINKAWALALVHRNSRREELERALILADLALNRVGAGKALRDLVTGHAASIRAFLLQKLVLSGAKPEELIALSQEAQQLLPDDEKGIRSVNALNIGDGYAALADLPAAENSFQQALEDGVSGGDYYAAIYGPINLILIAMIKGQLKNAKVLCEANIDRFNRLLAGVNFPPIGALYILKGSILLQENLLADAEQALSLGLNLVRWTGEFRTHMKGYSSLARLRSIQGDWAGLIDCIKALEETRPEGIRYGKALYYRFSAQDWAANKTNLEEMYQWAVEEAVHFSSLPQITGVDPVSETYFETYLNASFALTRLKTRYPSAFSFSDVHNYFSRLEQFATSHKLNGWLVKIWISRALMYHVEGKVQAANQMIQAALAAAVTMGYFEIFLEEADLMRPLLETAQRQLKDKDLSAFAHRLLEAMPTGSVTDRGKVDGQDPFSDREIEVLGLLASGQTYKEIGEVLFLSLNTVQFHVKNIYRKLLVNKREQAIEKARELNLI